MNQYRLRSYLRTQVATSDRRTAVLYLHDAAIRSCRKTIEAIEEGQPVAKGKWVDRAMTAVAELAAALDLDRGGALANRLNALYTFLMRTLIQANKGNDPLHAQECLSVLRVLREGWEQIAQGPESKHEPAGVLMQV